MPALNEATTTDEKVAALEEVLDDISTSSRQILRTLTDRDLVVALAADSGQCHRLTETAGPLVELGALFRERMVSIGNLGRTFDQLCDPATIPEVR